VDEERFAAEALRREFITRFQLEDCRKFIQAARKRGEQVGLAEMMVLKGFMTQAQADLLRSQLEAVEEVPEPAPPPLPPPPSPAIVPDPAPLQRLTPPPGPNPTLPPTEFLPAPPPAGPTDELLDLRIQEELQATESSERDILEEATKLPTAPGKVFGPYTLLEELEPDGLGTLHKAQKGDRVIALRILPSFFSKNGPAVEKLKREAKARVALIHPNLLKYLAFGMSEGRYFCAMDLVQGTSLGSRVRASGALTEPQLMRMGSQIAGALAVVHQAGLFHGNVDPDHVLIDSSGQFKLMEVDLTCELPAFSCYRAPEENRRDPAIDARAEIYALGASLFFAAAGAAPWNQTGEGILPLQMIGPPEAPLGEPLRSLIRQMMVSDPNARPKSAAEVEQTIRGSAANLPALKQAPKLPPRRRRF
jgi:serine/threonine protein kinase